MDIFLWARYPFSPAVAFIVYVNGDGLHRNSRFSMVCWPTAREYEESNHLKENCENAAGITETIVSTTAFSCKSSQHPSNCHQTADQPTLVQKANSSGADRAAPKVSLSSPPKGSCHSSISRFRITLGQRLVVQYTNHVCFHTAFTQKQATIGATSRMNTAHGMRNEVWVEGRGCNRHLT